MELIKTIEKERNSFPLLKAIYSNDLLPKFCIKEKGKITEYLVNNDVDLIVLDNYLIDGQGIEYLPELKGYPIIMITAANDVQTVEAALSNGVVDYLVKPFTYERFAQAIDKVQDYVKLLSKEKINQDLIDDYLNSGRVEEEEDSLPKGLSKITLKKVVALFAPKIYAASSY